MERAFSITVKDCDVQTFRAGGKGGQNQNARSTGVRIIHRPSGAIGESREHRTQLENKRAAFKRMASDPKMQVWINRMLYGYDKAERTVAEMMKKPEDFKVEVKHHGRWVLDSKPDA